MQDEVVEMVEQTALMFNAFSMEDLTSRKAAIDAMEEAKTIYHDRKAVIGKMQDIVNNLPSAGQWIPVTERFPKKEEYVLVTETNGNVDIAWLDDIWTEDGEELIWYAGECFRINVTAWMPLPEPWDDGTNYDREFWGDEK